jgi:electron transfer flavoprotein alpha/beta subunit
MSTVEQTVASLKGIPTREQLMETLKKEVAVVTFKKLNGDERKMPCTLITDFLPPAKKDDTITQKKVREISDKVCAVWAVESKGFRSFRYDRVTSIEIIAKEDYKVRLGEFWKEK